ncbi:hypothetical protein KIH74_28895 [Kineosporia sp. J2-2]|uniref:Uncharacterized protein n=1 Tax=Kineosporia corallincola TaxID=2835133 RepID=A0ABS5TPF9_9ACTN|nr:hypothetical protein [Kineosporia corallincola]MBT0772995.1 hypothetical protein [Kineosporia corallincola]
MADRYAQNQLARALVTAVTNTSASARQAAERRVRAWVSALDGIRSGAVTTGSRTPVAGMPPWVTLEVVRGGFATGRAMASGPLEADELARARALNLLPDRAAVFASYLTGEGLEELRTMVATGAYQVRIPEDAVLLVIGHLLTHGNLAAAQELLGSVHPHIGTLRFMPRAAGPRRTAPGQVSRQSASQVGEELRLTRPQPRVEAQREAAQVWQPLTDRFVALWLSAGNDWDEAHSELGHTLLNDYEQALESHRLCWKKSRVAGETLPRLVRATQARLEQRITEDWLRSIRELLAAVVAKRGEPGSEALSELRAVQARIMRQPSHARLAQVAAARCALLPADEGVPDVRALLEPVTEDEAAVFGVPAGAVMPTSVARKVRLGTIGSLESLIADGVIPSAEVLAELLPALTGLQVAAAYPDADLGRLMGAAYEAFRRRRSLLLLNLAKQVQFDELPWVFAVRSCAVSSGGERATAVARQVAGAAVDAWPGTLLPNPLIQELATLYQAGGESLPLVPEVAADIFERRFSPRFSAAALEAGTLLRGTLYERYYHLDFARLIEADDVATAFDDMCRAAAPSTIGRSVARNGMMIEHQQLLTTQNLAVLFGRGGVLPQRALPDLAVAAARHCDGLLRLAQHRPRPLATVKDAAYAWRQAVFFLTLAGEREHLAGFVEALTPEARWPMTEVLDGLRAAAAGECSPGRPLLGWTVTPHWAVRRAA